MPTSQQMSYRSYDLILSINLNAQPDSKLPVHYQSLNHSALPVSKLWMHYVPVDPIFKSTAYSVNLTCMNVNGFHYCIDLLCDDCD